jgi:RNA polymerase sigma factor (sigma-70 family)
MEEPTDRSHWVAEQVLPLESRLRRYVQRYLHVKTDDAANDLLQELYARILRTQINWSAIKNPGSYCEWVLKNIYVDRFRRAKVVSIGELPNFFLDVQADEAPGPEREVSAWEEYTLFTRSLAQLEADEREIFILRRFEGWKVCDIAVHFGMPVKTMDKKLATTQAKLVRLLAEAGVEAPSNEGRRDREQRETARKRHRHRSI